MDGGIFFVLDLLGHGWDFLLSGPTRYAMDGIFFVWDPGHGWDFFRLGPRPWMGFFSVILKIHKKKIYKN